MPLSPESHSHWFRAGCRAALSVPGFILLAAFIGFAGLANEAGFTLGQTLFLVLTVWALPSMVVLVGSVQNGLSLPATALAVALSAVRLMPMVVALVPEMRDTKTRRVTLYFLSHFIAVTSWVMSFQRFPDIPREQRTSFYAGLAFMLMVMNLAVAAVVHPLAKELPPTLSALLLFLTPMYFLTSLWGSAREAAGAYAMLLGLVLGPICHVLVPQADLLISGVLGGATAYGLQRWQQGRKRA